MSPEEVKVVVVAGRRASAGASRVGTGVGVTAARRGRDAAAAATAQMRVGVIIGGRRVEMRQGLGEHFDLHAFGPPDLLARA